MGEETHITQKPTNNKKDGRMKTFKTFRANKTRKFGK